MADYIEFTVNVNEDSAVDSQSSIDEKVKNSSDRPSEDSKLVNQARENMKENSGDNSEDKISGKGVKSFIMNNVAKEAINTGIKIAQEAAIQEFTYSGNTAQLNKMNNKINEIKSGISFGTNILGYTAAGASMGGPWGAAIGAVLGTVMSVVDSVISYNTNNSKLQWELQKESMDAQATLNRLGISSTGRGRIPFREFKM